jgi:hypothetical protein
MYASLKTMWEITTTLFNEKNYETDAEWGWQYENEGKTLLLNFQGSVSHLDWRQNFDFLAAPYKEMEKKFRVHRGFLNKWKSIRDHVQTKVTPEVEKVVILGFSQGGALAVLCHEDVWFQHERLRDSIETYAYGTPRVFSWATPKERFKGLHYIQYGGDMVCGVAPWIFGMKHMSKSRTQVIKAGKKWPVWFKMHPIHHMEYFYLDWSITDVIDIK